MSAVIGISGTSVWHFWGAVTLLGVGWNFAFIGATTIVTQCHRPEERNNVQSFNDFLIFGSMTISSFSSGALLAQLRLDRGQRGGVPAGGAGRPAAALAQPARAAAAGMSVRNRS